MKLWDLYSCNLAKTEDLNSVKGDFTILRPTSNTFSFKNPSGYELSNIVYYKKGLKAGFSNKVVKPNEDLVIEMNSFQNNNPGNYNVKSYVLANAKEDETEYNMLVNGKKPEIVSAKTIIIMIPEI